MSLEKSKLSLCYLPIFSFSLFCVISVLRYLNKVWICSQKMFSKTMCKKHLFFSAEHFRCSSNFHEEHGDTLKAQYYFIFQGRAVVVALEMEAFSGRSGKSVVTAE